jgi:hypothetical protein
MKTVGILVAALAFSLSAQAKIYVSSVISHGESTEKEATSLTSTLQGLGAKGHVDGQSEVVKMSGSITITNGAACENGHSTYSISLDELDANDQVVQTIKLDGSNECTKPSVAEKFNAILNTWGGKTLVLDCGAGHCWEKINAIECRHFNADKTTHAFDSCRVELASDL